MKKFLIIIVVIYVIATFFVIDNKKTSSVEKETKEERYMYFSYIEFSNLIKGKDIITSKKVLNEVINNIKESNFTDVIVHVRAFSDAFYESEIFPYSRYVSGIEGMSPGYDVLEYFITKAHLKKLKVHAWINPYRVRNTTDTTDISSDNPFWNLLKSGDAHIIDEAGIYYNPASSEVRKLIVKGVEEIVRNYEVDGIHFDDYFYPNNPQDLSNYETYKEGGGKLSLEEYRLNNTSVLIKEVYDSIKSINKNVVFGIAPEGNISNNYNSNYLDTKKLLSTEGYLDYIMPQIYYGFSNEVKPFIETIKEWSNLIKIENIKLIPALTLHKAGEEDRYAKRGSLEWMEENNIVKKQIVYSRTIPKYYGFALFRYSYFFNPDITNLNLVEEVSNIKNILIN